MPPSSTRIVESVLAIYYLSGALAEVVMELLCGGLLGSEVNHSSFGTAQIWLNLNSTHGVLVRGLSSDTERFR